MDPRDRRLLTGRLGAFQASAVGMVCVLLAVYAWLQLVRHSDFQQLALSQAVKERSVPAPRGIVYDRNGHRLVDNRKALHLVIAEEDLPRDPAVIEGLATALGLEPEPLKRKIHAWRQGSKGRSLVLMENLDEAGIALAERVRSRYPFLGVDMAPRRVYLGDELAGHLLGYVGEVDEALMKKDPGQYQLGEIVGKDGFERASNDRLKGQDGAKKVLVDQLGREVAVNGQLPAKAGRSLYLTLDAGLQRVVQESFGEEKGAAVVIDLRDGGILALYSSPSYDSNIFLNRLSQEMVDRYIRHPSKPMVNRVTQGIYAPGSTWKLLMAIAGLEKNVIKPETVIYCSGKKNYYGRDFRCDKHEGHGGLALVGAIAQSCDIYFYEVASRMDINDIYAVAEKYGLTVPTGIDLPFEKASRVPSREWKWKARKEKWYAGETISVGIGQGAVGLTPIALARFYALLGTKGKLLTPHLFWGFRNETTNLVEPAPAPPMKDTRLDPRIWGYLDQGLGQVVESGTAATNPFVRQIGKEIPFAGKTGTAQVATFVDRSHYARQAKELKDHAWFAGYAPRDNPQIAFAFIAENAGWGSTTAAPMAAKAVKYWCVDRLKNPLPPPGGKIPDRFKAPEKAEEVVP
ncbi:MAG TPA: penicillin-binding protein 2 [Holophagaceae bacterium]|nr:penicillin-binding protein 2 [Holophagaceae bacterium]